MERERERHLTSADHACMSSCQLTCMNLGTLWPSSSSWNALFFFCFPSDSIGTLISLRIDPRLSHSHFGCTKPLDCNHRSYRYLEVALVLFTFETNRSILLVYVDSLWLLPDPPEKISSSYFVETSIFFEVYEDPFDHQCAHQTEICHPLLPCSGNNI